MPRIKKIAAMFSYEMKVKPARRFIGVEKIMIACLLTSTGTHSIRDKDGYYEVDLLDTDRLVSFVVDSAVVCRFVPFVSSFPSLRNASVACSPK